MTKRNQYSLLSVLIASSSIALANPNGTNCASISDNDARLKCYDRSFNAPVTQKNKNDTGKWRVENSINPIDDSKTVKIYLQADSGKNRWGKPIMFVARCSSNKTEAYVRWDSYISDEPYVLSRVGGEKAQTSIWEASTDHEASFHRAPIPFLRSMLEHDKLLLQTTPYNENPIIAIFDTKGLNNAIKSLRETCQW